MYAYWMTGCGPLVGAPSSLSISSRTTSILPFSFISSCISYVWLIFPFPRIFRITTIVQNPSWNFEIHSHTWKSLCFILDFYCIKKGIKNKNLEGNFYFEIVEKNFVYHFLWNYDLLITKCNWMAYEIVLIFWKKIFLWNLIYLKYEVLYLLQLSFFQ